VETDAHARVRVGVSRDRQGLLTRGYGMADLEAGAAITAQTSSIRLGAKQFTATP